MRIERLPAARGRTWVIDGFRLLRRAPLALLALSFLYLLILMLTTVVPLIGPCAPMLATPLLSVGLMHAVRAAGRGEHPAPQMLFAALREPARRQWRSLLVLGAINATSTLAALGLASLADDGTLLRIATGQTGSDDPSLQDASLLLASMIFLAAYTPVQMALWFAPLFCAWHGVPPLKALFFSLVAVMRNRWAFLQFALGWVGVALLASLLIQMLKALLGGSPLLMSLVLSPTSLLVLTALYCSFWATYRDVVSEDSTAGATAPDQPADDRPAGD
jgi:hypothetical protein